MLLFLNSSPEIMSDERFSNQVASEICSTPGLMPSRVVLEITDRSKEFDLDGLTRSLDALRTSGLHIAIEEEGAGTSGLNRITILRTVWLKLDRELDDNIDHAKFRKQLIGLLAFLGTPSSNRLSASGLERI